MVVQRRTCSFPPLTAMVMTRHHVLSNPTPELLSLPLPVEGNVVSIPFGDLLGRDGRDIVGDLIHSRLLCVDEARSLLASNAVRTTCSDPRLRDPKTHKGFIKRLLDADLVELHDEAP